MKYNRCIRCELNYINTNEQICDICKKEMSGDYISEECIVEDNICPFCEKNSLISGEEMCATCRNKKNKKEDSDLEKD